MAGTLLNSLFGTTFPEMDAMQGRSQTTKGVWAAKDHKGSKTLVIDVEGTDSKERGEDRLVSVPSGKSDTRSL